MSDLTERMLHLRQVPVAAALSPRVLKIVAEHLEERLFAEGERLVTEGEPMASVILLTDGALALERGGAAAGSLGAPQTVGFLEVLANLDASFSATARSAGRAFVLSSDLMSELLEDYFELTVSTIRYFAEYITGDLRELPEVELGVAPVDLDRAPGRPVDWVEKILALRRTTGFADANVHALGILARRMQELSVPAGTTIWQVGERAERAFYILRGTIRCEAADGRVFRYGAGTGLGALEALADLPRWFSATAETDAVGLYGHTDRLLDLFEHELRMATDFVTMLARETFALVARRIALGQQPLRVKLNRLRVGA